MRRVKTAALAALAILSAAATGEAQMRREPEFFPNLPVVNQNSEKLGIIAQTPPGTCRDRRGPKQSEETASRLGERCGGTLLLHRYAECTEPRRGD